jgi:hypothetical protein
MMRAVFLGRVEVVTVAFVLGTRAYAFAPARSLPAFDVASIKRNRSVSPVGRGLQIRPEQLEAISERHNRPPASRSSASQRQREIIRERMARKIEHSGDGSYETRTERVFSTTSGQYSSKSSSSRATSIGLVR